MPYWTVRKLKEELPAITVKYNHRAMNASIVGRKNKMASVVISGIGSFDLELKFIVDKLNKNGIMEVGWCMII